MTALISVHHAEENIEAVKQVLEALNCTHCSHQRPFASLVSLFKVAEIAPDEDGPTSVISFGVNPETNRVDLSILVVNGQILPVSRIHSGAQELLLQLTNATTMCLHEFTTGPRLLDIQDDLKNCQPGYSFAVDPRNGLVDMRKRFTLHVLRSFAQIKDDGTSSLDAAAVKIYLKHCQRLQELMLTAEHLFR